MKTKTSPIQFLGLGLSIYLVSSLISMAVMSVGFGFLWVSAVVFLMGQSKTPPLELLNLSFSETFDSDESQGFFHLSLALASACILSLFAAWVVPLQFAGEGPTVHIFSDIFKLWYLALPFFLALVLNWLTPEKRFEAIRIWLLAAGVLSVVGVIQFFTGWPRPQIIPTLPQFYHATLFLGHHLSTASIFIFPFFIGLTLIFSKSGPKALTLPPWALKALVFLMAITLALTWSRMLWIALPLGVLVWTTRFFNKKTIGLFIILGIFATAGVSQIPQIQQRFHHAAGSQDRLDLWKINFLFFEKRPWIGVGWRKPQELSSSYYKELYGNTNNQFIGHAHNNFIEMLSGTGLLGTLIWLAWNYWVFRMIWIASRSRNIYGDMSWGIFCAWIVFHLNGLTQVNFWEGKVLHQAMWAIGLTLFQLKTKNTQIE